MIIQHNIMALNAHRQLGGNNTMVSKNLEKLSSGFRINRAGDDAAGLAISEKMRAQITGLTRATSNAQDGISLVQTAEGALTEVHSMLNRMVDLATQASNGTMQKDDQQKIQDEVSALLEEVDRISKSTTFNGITLLDGSLGGSAKVSTTAGADATTTFAAGTKTAGTPVAGAAGDWSGADIGATAAATKALTLNVGGVSVPLAGITLADNADVDDALAAVKSAIDTAVAAHNAAGAAGTATYSAISDVAVTVDGTSGFSVAFQTTAHTATAVAATGAVTSLDFTGKTGADVIGTTVKVGDTTYEFVKTGDTAKTGNTGVELADAATASQIATALQGEFAATGYTAAVNGDALAITSDTTGAASTAATVKMTGGLSLQIGDTADDFNKVSVSVADMSSEGLGIDGIDVTTPKGASDAIKTIKDAINTVSANRSTLGALQNRLEHTINNLGVTAENMTAAESRIRDVDMAKEMMAFTKNNVLTQAAQAMLAQANQQPQQVLQLLR